MGNKQLEEIAETEASRVTRTLMEQHREIIHLRQQIAELVEGLDNAADALHDASQYDAWAKARAAIAKATGG